VVVLNAPEGSPPDVTRYNLTGALDAENLDTPRRWIEEIRSRCVVATTDMPTTAKFELAETPPFGIRGSYAGEIVRKGDTLWIHVTHGVLANRQPPDRPSQTTEFISAALNQFNPDGTFATVARGTRVPAVHTLSSGDEVEVGPFSIRIVNESSADLDLLRLRMVHRMRHRGDRIGETYTNFPGVVGMLFGAPPNR
jgi:hypothetical protein